MAPTLSTVHSWNASLSSKYSSLTAVFVGATSGIGLETLKQFASCIPNPKVYIVGRSQAKSQPLLDELKELNGKGEYIFLEAEISQLKNVDNVCSQIKAQETTINLLMLSPGYISWRGREPTPDGLDTSMALRYYARVRFMQQLLPLMTAPLARIMNILAGGKEGQLDLDDLALRDEKKYGIGPAAVHSSTMLTLTMHKLAKENPNVSFVHTFPGLVSTPAFQRGMNPWFQTFMRFVAVPIISLVGMTQERSGEWHLFYATSDNYPAAGEKSKGADGVQRMDDSGLYLIDAQKGKTEDGKMMRELEGKGAGEAVWKHTEEVFEAMEK